MTRDEKKYVISRVHKIHDSKFVEISRMENQDWEEWRNTRHNTTTVGNVVKGIVNGDLTVENLDNEVRIIGEEFSVVFVVKGFKFEEQQGNVFSREKYDAMRKALNAEVNRITDSIMLGNADEALALIKAFEQFNVV